MARCPFAIWQPLNALYVPNKPKVAHNRMTVHITAGLGNPWGYFNAPRRASSEYFVSLNGFLYQYGDSTMQFEADLDGNDATHSVENEGRWGPLTAAQVRTNARLFKWLRDTHGIANKIATDSKPGPSSWGLAWHRLGIDGNFPALPSPLAGRIQRGGGMRYSTSRGKECPTAPVIYQIPEIFKLSQPVADTPPLPPTPVEPPINGIEDDVNKDAIVTFCIYNLGRVPSEGMWREKLERAGALGLSLKQVHDDIANSQEAKNFRNKAEAERKAIVNAALEQAAKN